MTASVAPRKAVNRAWHAFFYAFGAVAAPYLVTEDRLEEIAVSRQLMDMWLVGGYWNMTFTFPYIGNFIIPIDFHIFQGV